MGKFEELKVWQKARDLSVYIYRVTAKDKFATDFGLRDQIRRAAVSIASNIAEGDEYGTNKQAIKFFYIAKGSSAEVLTQTIIAKEIGYIDESHYGHIKTECRALSAMLTRLIQARSDP